MPRQTRLAAGKVPADVLRRCVFPYLGAPSGRVLKGPAVGEDAPVIDMGDRVLVAKANPVTGADRNLGGLVVHVNANDVATRGARPLWFMNVVLLPEGTPESRLREISREVDEACRSLGVSLIGGHTECTPGLSRPVASGFMLGEAPKDRYVSGEGVKPGDRVILTKGAGIEGTGILAADLADRLRGRVGEATLRRARGFAGRLSVVPEALRAAEAGGVHSMHTPTEGGVLNGLLELAEAAGLGLLAREEAIPVEPETAAICEALGADPLRLIASGALLLTVDAEKTEGVLEALRGIGVKATEIGEITPKARGRRLTRKDGKTVRLAPVKQDELYRLLGEV